MPPSLARLLTRPPAVRHPAPAAWRKWDLIHALADIHGYRNLLEISTPGSAGSYPLFDRSRFDVCRRLSYLTPDGWTDGAPIDYRSAVWDTTECTRQIRAEGRRFDIVFVDACHEYDTTRRDLDEALGLVTRKGVVVVHDCLPERLDVCTPLRAQLVTWFGVTYKRYLDVLMSRKHLSYCTVDVDCGCGMIRASRSSPIYRRGSDAPADLVRLWQATGDDYSSAFRIYETNRRALMNVVSIADFLDAETGSTVWPPSRLFSRWQRPPGAEQT